MPINNGNNDPENQQQPTGQFSTLTEEKPTESNAIQISEISLPKGGGALKGIDEKFEVNSANGSAGFSIPLPVTPGRSNFSPSLSLSYNSGGGNSPYGLGWTVDYPMIQRKTDKKLPRYRDGLEEDVFMLAGAEDLVPYLVEDTVNGGYKSITTTTPDGYTVKRYRPRIEGGFARIEKISHATHGSYWKVTSKENTATFFGKTVSARIADPEDATRIYQWLPEFSYNDKGSWMKYEYKQEDTANIPNELHEKHRKNGNAPFTNTYLKRIVYGNRIAYFADKATPYDPQPRTDDEYFFELVMDYGEHDALAPTPQETGDWAYRADAFSTYRSGFEIRTNRLCERVLLFHHFKDETQFTGTTEEEIFGANYLVQSLDLEYEPSSINNSGQTEVTYLKSITQTGYIRKPDSSYSKKSLPPMEFTYEKLNWNKEIKTISEENIVNAPVGLTNNYQWVDLYGEGIAGILTEQGAGWYYKSNLGSPNENGEVAFTNGEKVIPKPSLNGLSNGTLSIQDLASNGEKQVVVNSQTLNGYFELTEEQDWKPFQHFEQVANIDINDKNTRLLDLNGDGQPELVVTEENVFTWYNSEGKKGFSAAAFAGKPFDEEKGPAIVFADDQQTIFLADLSGDGLTDIVRIRNGEICYWANMGYGKFSTKVSMTNAPTFDHPDLFNPKYLHLADVSGTGATDIIYLGQKKFKAFINLSGNAWSDAHEINPFFPTDSNSQISVIDLLGTGTSCLVWSSDLPAYRRAPMRYIDLMDSKKPHVLIHYKNNFGKETSIEYKSSTYYYLKDKLAGTPWITKLPFPVQVASKHIVEEKITDVRFTSEYTYHHGYYDHQEREFRGFGMVEQTDSEHYTDWSRNNLTNSLEESEKLYQQPVLTKSWFHTGAFLDREKILTHYESEYWYEVYNNQFPTATLTTTEPALPDARLSDDVKALNGDEYREALRACKGMLLRKEVFALDAPESPTESALQLQMKPYTVSTHNCNLQLLQPRADNQFGVFLVTESEAIMIHYERDETDFRIAHTVNTEIDELGNILESASIVYGRKQAKADTDFQLLENAITDFSEDVLNNNAAQMTQLQNAFQNNIDDARGEQIKTHINFTQSSFAKFKDGLTDVDDIDLSHAYRLRMPYEVKTYELTGLDPASDLFEFSELENILSGTTEIDYLDTPPPGITRKRLIEHTKTSYLKDDLTVNDFEYFDILGLPYESYQLAYTPALVNQIYQKLDTTPLEADGDIVSDFIETKGKYFNIDGNLWIRSGITQFKENPGEAITNVQSRFFSPLAFEDPFGAVTSVAYDVETFAGATRNNDGYYLFVRETTDNMDNKVQVNIFNYRTMSPSRMIDLNANPSSVVLDELGLTKATATEGNGNFTNANRNAVDLLELADNLSGIKEYTEGTETANIALLFGAATSDSTNTTQLRQAGNDLLQGASSRYIYDFNAYANTGKPTLVASVSREEHFTANANSAIQFSFEYTDGLGKVAMTKAQAEPGLAYYMESEIRLEKDTGTDLRWAGNGRTVLNNKGNPVKKYEPYFSTNFLYENAPELVEIGVTPILYYDAIGRQIKIEFPDKTLSRVEFDSWKQYTYDQNDTVLESECEWYTNRINNLIDAELTAAGKDPAKEKQAAQKAAAHADTPTCMYLDSLGRPVLSMANNGKDSLSKDKLYTSFIELDIEGNAKSITDSRGNTVMAYKYDMLGHRVYENSMDSGERWVLNNLMGNPIHRWDNRDHVFTYTYDSVQRPDSIIVKEGNGATPLNHIYSKSIYGEGQANEYQFNLRGKVFQQYDTAGIVQSVRFDFKGNPLESSQRLNSNYKDISNWTAAAISTPSLEPDIYSTTSEFDALNRPVLTLTPDNSETKPVFNEAGMLEQVLVKQIDVLEKIFVKNIDYDAKGQRQKIVYGDSNGFNLATTTYHYDTETFRLLNLRTTKSNNDLLQDLYFTYDPVGNITEIEDKAIPEKFFNNFKIEPKGLYEYDSMYRLTEAQGKEHAGQAISFGQCDNWKDTSFLKSYSAGDDMAWRNFTQRYSYDPVGNILETNHIATGGNWSRTYQYETINNRLIQTQVGTQIYTYTHHAEHGFITSMPHLSVLEWNFKDQLQAVARQVVCNDNIPPETTYYVYDSKGIRVRKVTENFGGGSKKEERIYLGSIEIYKKHSGTNNGLERTSLYVLDDTRRIAMVDTRNEIDDDTDLRTVRFQLGNHIDSACLELDDSGNVISYEEYHPFGTTAYQAVNKDIKAAAKRYRYTGMERDEESGLEYHSARYYLTWLGRWLSADPLGLVDGDNLYRYSRNNPVKLNDPNGTDPPDEDDEGDDEDPVTVTPLLTQIRPLSLSGGFQLQNPFSSNRSASGQLTLSGGVRSSFRLQIPAIGVDTTGVGDAEVTADVDTQAGSASVDVSGGVVLGGVTSWNRLLVVGEGSLRIPVPDPLVLNQASGILTSQLHLATGNLSLHGSFGNLGPLGPIATFSGGATLDTGQFSAELQARSLWDIARLNLNATGNISADNQISLSTLSGTARVSLPLLRLDANVFGTGNATGGLDVTGRARLRLFGIPSVSAYGTGTLSTQGYEFSGAFSGYIPPLTYVTGGFDLSSTQGVDVWGSALGLTYTPSIDVTDPSPLPAAASAHLDVPEPPVTSGLTLGYSFTRYRNGGLTHFSVGAITNFKSIGYGFHLSLPFP